MTNCLELGNLQSVFEALCQRPNGIQETLQPIPMGWKRVLSNGRFDGKDHYLVQPPNGKRRRRAGAGCKKAPNNQDNKCDIGLGIGCNFRFHKE